jgi:hypothetical protein
MSDLTTLHINTERRIARLIASLRPQLSLHGVTVAEELLGAHEYGIALEQLAGAVIEERKDIDLSDLREFAGIAAGIGMQDDLFLHYLQNYYDSRHPH